MNSCRSWRYTKRVCYLGYVVQAVINNYAALLFLTFQKEYQLSIEQVGLLAAVNFGTQLLTDFSRHDLLTRSDIEHPCFWHMVLPYLGWPGSHGSLKVHRFPLQDWLLQWRAARLAAG